MLFTFNLIAPSASLVCSNKSISANAADVEHDRERDHDHPLDGSTGSHSNHTTTAGPAGDIAHDGDVTTDGITKDDDSSEDSNEGDTIMMESKMDAKVAAMLLTPLDLDTSKASQCKDVAYDALSVL